MYDLQNVQDLGAAIVQQAIRDYKKVLKYGDHEGLSRAEIENFFSSPLFGMICPNTDGEAVLFSLRRRKFKKETRGRKKRARL